MPRTKSAKKAMRQGRRRRARNKGQMSALRTAVKKARNAAGDAAVVGAAGSALDRAARKGLIHRNRAARTKRRLAKAGRAGAGSA